MHILWKLQVGSVTSKAEVDEVLTVKTPDKGKFTTT